MDRSFRVIAIIAAYNEGDIISAVIGHLVENGVDVYVMDNRSTDDTADEARRWLGRGVIGVETFPGGGDVAGDGAFDWTAILRRKEELASELRADWFIHHDADEVRDGPWPGLSLAEAIRWVDGLGYNCIDFRTLNFPPVDDNFRQGMDPKSYFTRFEDVQEFDREQRKCWKAGPVSLVPSGGHDAAFAGRRIFPIPFLLRHYPIRGQSHGTRKVFAERKGRMLDHEHAQGWHLQYDHVEHDTHRFLRSAEDLTPFDLDRTRLELMLPDNVRSGLEETLARADADLRELRAQLAGARQGLDEYRRHAVSLEGVRGELETRVAGLATELDEYRLREREHALALDALVRSHEARVDGQERARLELEAQVAELRQVIAAMRASRTWRLATAIRRLVRYPERK